VRPIFYEDGAKRVLQIISVDEAARIVLSGLLLALATIPYLRLQSCKEGEIISKSKWLRHTMFLGANCG
jgi:hypothetical protein